MSAKFRMNLLMVFVIAFLIAGFAVNVRPVYALGTPQITSINPGLSPQLLFLANVADSFSDRDIINIGGNIYVIVDRQRRHVPNPETLDALGISRSMINNRGFSDADLNSIPQGPDIPDVIRDPSGFKAFKDWIFPDLPPIGQPAPTQTQPPQQNGHVADSFNTGDIINISGNIYVIVDRQRRHVPNPETLDALGIGRDRINNRGYSDSQLSTIPQGPDIPDVNRDYLGFKNFKNQYFPGTTPIVTATQPGTSVTQPGTSGSCPSAPAKIKIGDIAVVTDYQPSWLRIRRQPGLDQDILGEIPVNEYVSIISGPRCVDGYRWWEVGYNGMDGWSAEVGSDGLYNLIPNTTQTHEQPTQVVVQPTLKPSVVETTVPAPAQQAGNASASATSEPTSQGIEDPPWCDWAVLGWLFCENAKSAKAAGVNTDCYPQCVQEAHIQRKDLDAWAAGKGSALSILNTALSQNPYIFPWKGQDWQVYVRSRDEQPQAEDLIIWPKGCEGVIYSGGHIGYVASTDPLKVIDANWDNKCSILDRTYQSVPSCVRFISKPVLVQIVQDQPKSIDVCSQYHWWDPRGWLCRLTH